MTRMAWVIGGTSGIGLEAANRLKNQVDEVVALGRSADYIASARQRLGDAVTLEKVDLYDWRQVNDLCKRLEDLPDRIQYLVNAAGTFVPKTFLDHQVEDYDKYMALNRSLYFVTQAVVGNMKRNGGGSIVNIWSMWAHQAIKATPSSAYSMVKGRTPCIHSASRDGTCGRGNPRQRDRSRCGQDACV
jgi:short-subunit dehydrogenase